MVPAENITWYHEDPTEGHVPHYQFILIHYNTTHGNQLTRNLLPHQDLIYSRYLGNKMPHTNNRHRTYRRTQMHNIWI